MVSLASKCYFADSNTENEKIYIQKVSCKGTNKKQNKMIWERYKYALLNGGNDYVKNTGFRKENNKVKTYSQVKLGLSAYNDKRVIHEDGIHTSVLW